MEELEYVDVAATSLENGTIQQVTLSLNDRMGEDIYTVAFHICEYGPPQVDAEVGADRTGWGGVEGGGRDGEVSSVGFCVRACVCPCACG